MTKCLLYARKSTDEDVRQVLSIESQLIKLRELARRESLEIVEEFVECRTAKEPGRPVFNAMIAKRESGLGGQGILAWHPDRLARNSIDGGKIIYLVDTGKIAALKFPTFWFENTPQGKFMLNISFGQSKYFVDNLAENVRRGIRMKLRKGEKMGLAPAGYMNDLRTHTIVKDPQVFKIVLKMFETYAGGEHSLKQIQMLAHSLYLRTRTGKPLVLSQVQRILQNHAYYGMFTHRGELYQGIHEPIVSKQLFDEVQRVLKNRGKPRKPKRARPFEFLGTFKCGECGRAITAEKKVKKSGLSYTYYRCTKKGTTCRQKYLRDRELERQVDAYIQKVALSREWADAMLKQLEKDRQETAHSQAPLAQNLRKELESVQGKLDRLATGYLESAFELGEYRAKKKEFLEKKVSLKERMANLGQGGLFWLEPMREWILSSVKAQKLETSEEKRNFLRKIGSNFVLAGGRIGFSVLRSYSLNFLAGTSGRFSDGKKKECARVFKTASFLPTSRPSIVGPANRTFSKWSGQRESNPHIQLGRLSFYH